MKITFKRILVIVILICLIKAFVTPIATVELNTTLIEENVFPLECFDCDHIDELCWDELVSFCKLIEVK